MYLGENRRCAPLTVAGLAQRRGIHLTESLQV